MPSVAKSPIAAVLLACSAALAASPVAADTVYKSTLPGGHVVYGSRPEKAAAKVEKLAPAAPIIEVEPEAAEAQRERERTQGAELDKRLAARRNARAKAESEVAGAEDAVKLAEKALASGSEPLPGERVATADGGSRLSDAHFSRLKSLQDDVKAAKLRLDQSRRDLVALD
jgi:hypothetical protein